MALPISGSQDLWLGSLTLSLSLSDLVLNSGNIYFYFMCRTQREHYTTLMFGKGSYFKTKLAGDVFHVCDISSSYY